MVIHTDSCSGIVGEFRWCNTMCEIALTLALLLFVSLTGLNTGVSSILILKILITLSNTKNHMQVLLCVYAEHTITSDDVGRKC